MGEVHNPGHAEHNRQADRDQKQRGCAGKSGDRLGDDEAHNILQRRFAALTPHDAIRWDAAS